MTATSKLALQFRCAFTMVEMLVVFAILAVLAAILFPVLRGALTYAKERPCVNNLRQIHAAALLYANDHGGWQPNMSSSLPEAATGYWKQAMMTYVKSPDTFYCPSDPDARTSREKMGSTALHTSYWGGYGELKYWERGKPNGTAVRLRFDAVEKPAEELYLYDREKELPEVPGEPQQFSTSHGDRMNTIYMDGHAESLQIKWAIDRGY